jgi:hypothetical protein
MSGCVHRYPKILCDICGKSAYWVASHTRYNNFHTFRAAIENGEGAQDAVGDVSYPSHLIYDFEVSLEAAEFQVCSPDCAETLYRWTPGERRSRLVKLGREMASATDVAERKAFAREVMESRRGPGWE